MRRRIAAGVGCASIALAVTLTQALMPSPARANGAGSPGEPTAGRVAVATRVPALMALPSILNTLVSRTAGGNVVVYEDTSEDIGGVLSSAPSATYLGLKLYVVGSNGGIVFLNSKVTGTWTGWTSIGSGSDPVVTTYGTQVHVVYRAANGNVMDTWLEGDTWTTANLGGTIAGTPAAITYGDQFQVFGANGGIVFQKWFWPTTFTWYGWTAISTGSDPSLALFTDELHVLSRGSGGNVLDRWYGAGTWTSQDLGGIIAGMPVAAGLPDVFRVVGANDGVVYQRTYRAGLWSAWLAFSLGRDPVAIASTLVSVNTYSVYSRMADETILQIGSVNDVPFLKTYPE